MNKIGFEGKTSKDVTVWNQKFVVELEADEDGVYCIVCPGLQGCLSEGDTIKEALINIKEAIELYLESIAIRDLKIEIPKTDAEKNEFFRGLGADDK